MPAVTHIDTLINAGWIVPVEPEGLVLERHSLTIRDGRILEILPSTRARDKYAPATVHDLPGHVLIPGLINAHTHAAMSLMRGLADDMPLMRWLNEHIWPAESRWVGEEFVADGSRLAVAEMLRGGTTCFSDMYFFPEVTGQVAAHAGIRAVLGLIVLDFPTVYADAAEGYLARGLQVHDEFRSHPHVGTAFAPHAPYSVSNAPLERIRVLADELEIPIHMHVHETADEVRQALGRTGQRPLARLHQLGLVSPALNAVHMTQLQADEIERLAAAGAHVIHCPESNLKLASGFCPVARLLKAGVNLALGTDGAASNNDLDMFGEMRSAALLAKGVAGDATTLPAARALRMATLNGAKALGIDNDTGSLTTGKWADVVAVDLSGIEGQPVHHPISQLVYATSRHQVSHVWVAGRPLLAERALTTLDEAAILERAREWQIKIASA